jgi:uncharacterized membrane protein
MKIFLISFTSSLVSLIAIDAVWLTMVAKSFYAKHIGHLMADSINLFPIAVFYPLYAAILSLLIIIPAVTGDWSIGKTFVYGALLGLAAYAAYDLTNHATLKDWSLAMTIVDMAWGTLLTGGVSAIAVMVVRYFS